MAGRVVCHRCGRLLVCGNDEDVQFVCFCTYCALPEDKKFLNSVLVFNRSDKPICVMVCEGDSTALHVRIFNPEKKETRTLNERYQLIAPNDQVFIEVELKPWWEREHVVR